MRLSLSQLTRPTVKREPPPYGHRKNWVPRSLADFGDGGAFPEIHVAQYPMNMGNKSKSAAVSLTINSLQSIAHTDIILTQLGGL